MGNINTSQVTEDVAESDIAVSEFFIHLFIYYLLENRTHSTRLREWTEQYKKEWHKSEVKVK